MILHKDYKTLTYNLLNRNHVFAPIGYQKTVYIVKTGLHYNTLLPKEYENPLMRREQERRQRWRKSWTPQESFTPIYSKSPQESFTPIYPKSLKDKECRKSKRTTKPTEKKELFQKQNLEEYKTKERKKSQT